MTKPTDDIRPFRPYAGPLTLLQLLSVIALAGVVVSFAAYFLFS